MASSPFRFPILWRRGGGDTAKRRRARVASAARIRRGADGTIEAAPPLLLRIRPARAALGMGTAALLSFLLCIHLLPNRVSLRLGDEADRLIIAQRTVRYEDRAETEQRRQDAAAQVPDQFDLRPEAATNAQEFVREIFDAIERVRAAGAKQTDPSEVANELRQTLGVAGLRSSLSILMKQAPRARNEARRVALDLAEQAMSQQITDQGGSLTRARQALERSPALAELPAALRPATVDIAGAALSSNQTLNSERTRRERAGAASAVPPRIRRLFAGAVVIRPGERVTQQHLDAFEALDLQNPRLDTLTAAVVSLLVVLLTALVAVYLARFHPGLYRDTSCLLLLALLTIVSVVGLKVGSTLLGLPVGGALQLGYLGMICVASSGMAIALLLSPAVATLIVALLAVVSGLVLDNELRFTVVTLASSLVGIVSVANLRNRGDLLRAVASLCLFNALLIVLVGRIEGDTVGELGTGALWGVMSGVFAVALFWIGIAALEKPFGVTTHVRLVELCDPATPILQEFRMRVPGTYAHSLMVGNLAHAGAEAIGADALLVRVAAYYHDVGKMNRPEFFIENQGNGENIHDRLSPSMSALVLTSHVKDGLEIAQEVGLPPHVRDVIRQHHGTSLMKYFYYRATGGVNDPSMEHQFRYAGPKPQSKEAAILMLADSVEAASRTLDKPTPSRIVDFVRSMIEDKRADGQLDDSDLTLRDLKKIQDVFVRILSGTLHARIDYPGSATAPAPAAAPKPVPVAATPLTLTSFGEDEPLVTLTTATSDVVDAPSAVDGTSGTDGSEPCLAPPGAAHPGPRGRGKAATRGR